MPRPSTLAGLTLLTVLALAVPARAASPGPEPSPPPTQPARAPDDSERALELVRRVDPRFADIPTYADASREWIRTHTFVPIFAGPWINVLPTTLRLPPQAGMRWLDLGGRVVEVMLVADCADDADEIIRSDQDVDPCAWRHSWLYHVDHAGAVTLVSDAGSPEATWPGVTPSPEASLTP